MDVNADKHSRELLDSQSKGVESCFLVQVQEKMAALVRSNSRGPLRNMVEDICSQRGKMLRPRIVRDLGLALGVAESASLGWAICCEILHTATLIHDDLQDGDECRRGAPAFWVKYGANHAINAGDFLLMLAPRALLASGYSQSQIVSLLRVFSDTCAQMAVGQSHEIELRKDIRSSCDLLGDYFDCIGGKTARLFACLASGVGSLAELDSADLNKLESLFFDLGQVFQIQDDILDLFGDKQRGEIGCDIKEGKVSFLVASHLNHFLEDLDSIAELLLKPRAQTTTEEILGLKSLFEAKGTLEAALRLLQERSQELLGDPWLQAREPLARLIRVALKDLLKPIEHLYIKSGVGCEL